jgi:transposase
VPEAFPAEFRADVIAVARKGEAPLRQIAKGFGVPRPACIAGSRSPTVKTVSD